MQDGSMRSYNIIIKPQDLAILDAAPMAEKYVPCDFVANYNPSNTSNLPAERNGPSSAARASPVRAARAMNDSLVLHSPRRAMVSVRVARMATILRQRELRH